MSVAAVAAALVLGLFAASALGWSNGGGGGEETTPTETTPTETTPPPEEVPPEEEAPVGELPPAPPQAQVLPAPLAVGTELQPAAPAAVAPVAVAPEEGVKGETGTRDEGQAGGAQPTVLAQADVGEAPDTSSSGQLAATGFDVLMLALLGGTALAGSALLFWRTRAN